MIMKASELRKGNWVKTCIPDMKIMIPFLNAKVQGITIFDEIEFNHEPTNTNGFTMPDKHIMGIPLTEEILLKSGFIEFKIDEDFYLRKNDFVFEISGVFGFSIFDVDFELLSVNGNKVLKFVHQLQNLYFVLTGEELEIIL